MALITIQRTVVVCEDPRDVPVRPRRRLTRLAVAGTVIVVAAAGIGVSIAVADPDTTSVSFTALTTPVKVLGTTIPANKTASVVVIGASTTVPTNATTVELAVTAKGQTAGFLQLYPTGNVSAGASQGLNYPAGNTVVAATIDVNVGESNEVTISNESSHAATVSVKVLGYSTQVTAGDISPNGGTDGQVLMNQGDSVVWSSNFAKPPTDTIVVAPVGTIQQNGDALRAALTSGSGEVVEIESGVTYDLGSAPLNMAGEITLIGEGSQQDATIFASGDINLGTTGLPDVLDNVFFDFDNGGSIVASGGFQQIQNVTIESNATTNQGLAILVGGSAHVFVDDSTIASNTDDATSGGAEVADTSASLNVKDSEVDVDLDASDVTGYGILALGPVEIDGSTINVFNEGTTTVPTLSSQGSGTITVHASQVISQSLALDAGGSASIKSGASEIAGTSTTSESGTLTCVDDYTAAFVPVAATC